MEYNTIQIEDATARMKMFIDNKKRLPTGIMMGNTQEPVPNFLYSILKMLITKDNSITPLQGIKPPASTDELFVNGTLTEAEYLDAALRTVKYIETNKQVPAWVYTRLGKMPYTDINYNFSKIWNFIAENQRFPKGVSCSQIHPNNTTGSIQSRIQNGTGKIFTTFTEFYKLVLVYVSYFYYFNDQKTLSQEVQSIIDAINGINNGDNCVDFCQLGVALAREMGYQAVCYGIYCPQSKIWHAVFLIKGKEFTDWTIIDLAAAAEDNYPIGKCWCDWSTRVKEPSWIPYE